MFLHAAARHAGPLCRVIDHSDLTADSILEIARFFGLSGVDRDNIEKSLSTYSKDPTGQKRFVDDRDRKRSVATDTMRHECRQSALPAYLEARNHQFVIAAPVKK
jgi:hypothetical protein